MMTTPESMAVPGAAGDTSPASAVSSEAERPAAEPSSAPAWQSRDWLFLFLSALAAGWYSFGHLLRFMEGAAFHLPGIGLTLTQWLLIAAALFFAKNEGRLCLKKNPGGAFLLAVALGLGACYGIYANDSLRLMNLPVTLLSTSLALFSLTGVTQLSPWTGPGLLEGCRQFLPAFVRHMGVPFQALKSQLNRKNDRLTGIGVGLLAGIPAVGAALYLLTSADGMFSALLEDGLSRLANVDLLLALRVVSMLLGALFLYSFLASTTRRAPQPASLSKPRISAVSCATVLSMLAAVYGLFVYVQFRYLFGGAETAAQAGGYAEYARNGFFQLTLLALLTLLLILPALSLCRDSHPVRALCALVAALTGVIDFSAFFRMRLYIQAYGLSVLRLVTLWGIFMILLALGAALAKCARPGLRICPLLTAAALSTWLALNLCNPDAFIARRNIETVGVQAADLKYVSSLSPDVLPVLSAIEDPALRREAVDMALEYHGNARPAWYDWSLSWLKLPPADATESAPEP